MKTSMISLGVLLAFAGPGVCKTATTSYTTSYTDERALAAVLVAEAGGEGEKGMRAVAEVIRNRSASQRKSCVHVVCESFQFSCLNGTTLHRLIAHHERHARFGLALSIAHSLLHNPEHLGNAAHGADHYIVTGQKAFWMLDEKPVAVVGHHQFYRL